MTAQRHGTDIPSIDAAIEHLEQSTGRAPSVLALARHLGLANTTFRRRYPDIVVRLQASALGPDFSGVALAAPRTDDELLRLRHRNRELVGHLELATASIQRLSLDNRALRAQLEQLSSVTHLPRGR